MCVITAYRLWLFGRINTNTGYDPNRRNGQQAIGEASPQQGRGTAREPVQTLVASSSQAIGNDRRNENTRPLAIGNDAETKIHEPPNTGTDEL